MLRWTAIITVYFFCKLRSCDNRILFHWLSWICRIKNHSSSAYSKWMDLTALHDIFRFQHCSEVAIINWTRQFWIGNQFINTKECKFNSLDLIMIMLIFFWLLTVVNIPWVPEVLFFLREERAVKTERRKINLWSRRFWTSLPCKFGIRYLAKPVL